MTVFDVRALEYTEPSVIALGNFDGVHLGHEALIKRALQLAGKLGCAASVLLFTEHTENTLEGVHHPRLTSFRDKVRLIESLGITHIYSVPFDDQFKAMSPDDFIIKFLINHLHIRGIVVGDDYRFGHKAQGDVGLLQVHESNHDYVLEIVNAIFSPDDRVSSTRIRQALQEGYVLEANRMLGRPYRIRGIVIDGDKRGRTLGFPTANISTKGYVLPHNGVYATRITIRGKTHLAMTNIGTNPTFTDGSIIKVESHIFDFSESIYGETVILDFYEFIRHDMRFKSRDALILQMESDRETILNKLTDHF